MAEVNLRAAPPISRENRKISLVTQLTSSVNMYYVVLLAVCVSSVISQCPYAYTPLNKGTLCSQTSYCQALGGTGYECMNGQCCRINGLCNADEISVGYDCLRMTSEGGRCVNSAQCQPGGGQLQCVQGSCRRNTEYTNPTCSNPSLQVEREGGVVKDCMYSRCSVGFGCEYSQQVNKYICCGRYNAETDYTYGTIKMYPGTTLPLRCFKRNQCLWTDTPNCVRSIRYGYSVCCSTFNC